jgi:hypothetical protein
MTTKKSSLRPTSKTAWAKANDSGPHLAVLPSGNVVRFKIPNMSALVRSGRLPEALREAALIFSSHPEGPDELMRELVITAALRGPGQDTLSRMIAAGQDLTPHLLAEMLVEPELTAEEIAEGLLPELDVRMLLEFAERLRNVDAAGNQLPITTLDDWATFRREPAREPGARASGDNGAGTAGAPADADAGDV